MEFYFQWAFIFKVTLKAIFGWRFFKLTLHSTDSQNYLILC